MLVLRRYYVRQKREFVLHQLLHDHDEHQVIFHFLFVDYVFAYFACARKWLSKSEHFTRRARRTILYSPHYVPKWMWERRPPKLKPVECSIVWDAFNKTLPAFFSNLQQRMRVVRNYKRFLSENDFYRKIAMVVLLTSFVYVSFFDRLGARNDCGGTSVSASSKLLLCK